ncbi:LOW QUALITY PROTEIN: prostatic acid phosphatase-like [Xenia sp. Carnegie-2017]|uniref:LOW QUALITY PROTEIN: prostatic acid phosphatase-like n=1 Tax=Xenia sp. Carnegie-2017 TaxID=2897299 RepID=UPI001F05013C|nr:LOW QUALITY PROTEIN: prostatic acid phosphatase-like [Xenia sp. Carnegie-2017]
MFFKLFWSLLLLCCISSEGHPADEDWELQMANVVYRHGDRSPVATYPNNIHKDYWKQGFGQLTEIGMKQEFTMGKFLKERYIDQHLLNQSYLRNQVYCRSSDKDRCLMSAEAQMAGLYPPLNMTSKPTDKEWQFWQLIPIHTVPKDHDQLLRPYDYYDCPKLLALLKKSYSDSKYVAMENKSKDFIAEVSKRCYSKPLTLQTIYKAYDTFFCQKAHHLSWPDWLTPDVFREFERLQYFTISWLFASPERARLTGGVLLKEIIGNMNKFRSDPSKTKKLFVYSAHDTTVIGLLSALNIYNGIPPPYSTAFIMELYYSRITSKYSIKMFYRNDTSQPNYAYQLSIPNCSSNACDYDTFLTLTSSAVPNDLKAECHSKQKQNLSEDLKKEDCRTESSVDVLTAILIICILIFIAIIGFIVFQCHVKRKSRFLRDFQQISPDEWE